MEAGSMRVAGEKRESFLHFRFRCKKIRNDLLETCSSLSSISLAFFLSLSNSDRWSDTEGGVSHRSPTSPEKTVGAAGSDQPLKKERGLTTMGGSTPTASAPTVDPVPMFPLRVFAAALLFFHGSEFALAYAFQRRTLSRRCELDLSFFHREKRPSFSLLVLIGRKKPKSKTKNLPALLFSWPYALAMASAVVEYLVESILVSPRWSQRSAGAVPLLQTATTATGCLLVAAGEALRKAAMLTAARAFTHDLALKKEPTHGLVTCGVYSLLRHPGYAGFALWAVGTQLVLRNLVRGRVRRGRGAVHEGEGGGRGGTARGVLRGRVREVCEESQEVVVEVKRRRRSVFVAVFCFVFFVDRIEQKKSL